MTLAHAWVGLSRVVRGAVARSRASWPDARNREHWRCVESAMRIYRLAAAAACLLLPCWACSGSNGDATTKDCPSGSACPAGFAPDSPQAFAYDACQQHAFGGPGLLLEDVKSSVQWPTLNTGKVTVTGSSPTFRVTTIVVGDTPLGRRVSWPIDCDATRRPGRKWNAVVQVGTAVPLP